MVYDNDNLEKVAKIVLRYNSRASSFNVNELVGFMKSTAERNLGGLENNTYISTYGFMLTSYKEPGKNGGRGIKASVSDCLFEQLMK
jgi:hypothetical protein